MFLFYFNLIYYLNSKKPVLFFYPPVFETVLKSSSPLEATSKAENKFFDCMIFVFEILSIAVSEDAKINDYFLNISKFSN